MIMTREEVRIGKEFLLASFTYVYVHFTVERVSETRKSPRAG